MCMILGEDCATLDVVGLGLRLSLVEREISAESILTLKNCEWIHFGFLLRGFVQKELIHDS